jgi:hypothetical protein
MEKQNTVWKYDKDNPKEFTIDGPYPQHGATYSYITCPFCRIRTMAFHWSLAGSGKKCNGCGAMHTSTGKTYPLKK